MLFCGVWGSGGAGSCRLTSLFRLPQTIDNQTAFFNWIWSWRVVYKSNENFRQCHMLMHSWSSIMFVHIDSTCLYVEVIFVRNRGKAPSILLLQTSNLSDPNNSRKFSWAEAVRLPHWLPAFTMSENGVRWEKWNMRGLIDTKGICVSFISRVCAHICAFQCMISFSGQHVCMLWKSSKRWYSQQV